MCVLGRGVFGVQGARCVWGAWGAGSVCVCVCGGGAGCGNVNARMQGCRERGVRGKGLGNALECILN